MSKFFKLLKSFFQQKPDKEAFLLQEYLDSTEFQEQCNYKYSVKKISLYWKFLENRATGTPELADYTITPAKFNGKVLDTVHFSKIRTSHGVKDLRKWFIHQTNSLNRLAKSIKLDQEKYPNYINIRRLEIMRIIMINESSDFLNMTLPEGSNLSGDPSIVDPLPYGPKELAYLEEYFKYDCVLALVVRYAQLFECPEIVDRTIFNRDPWDDVLFKTLDAINSNESKKGGTRR